MMLMRPLHGSASFDFLHRSDSASFSTPYPKGLELHMGTRPTPSNLLAAGPTHQAYSNPRLSIVGYVLPKFRSFQQQKGTFILGCDRCLSLPIP